MALDKIIDAFKGGGAAAPDNPRDLPARLREQYGSNVKAAAATGIPESTLRRWEKGATPSRHNVEKAQRAGRDVITPRIARDGFAIQTRDNKDGRNRTISADQLGLTQRDLDRVREHVVKGDEAGARRAFLQGVKDPYYRQYLTPGSPVSRTGTVDGIGGGPAGAVSRSLFSGDDNGDYDDDMSDLAYEGMDDGGDGEYGGSVAGVIATVTNLFASGGRK